MNDKSVIEYLLSQGPTIVFMALVNYFQYRYFTQTLKSKDDAHVKALEGKDDIIRSKDDKIEGMYNQVIGLVKQVLDAMNKSSEIMSGLKGLLEVIRTDIKEKK